MGSGLAFDIRILIRLFPLPAPGDAISDVGCQIHLLNFPYLSYLLYISYMYRTYMSRDFYAGGAIRNDYGWRRTVCDDLRQIRPQKHNALKIWIERLGMNVE